MKIEKVTVHHLLHDFLVSYIPVQRRLSDCTEKNYHDSLDQYRKYLKEHKNVSFDKLTFDDFSKENVYNFLTWLLNDNHRSVNTVNLRLAAIKAFLKFCAEEDISLTKYYMDVRSIVRFKDTANIKKLKYLRTDQLELIFSTPDKRTPNGRRDRFFMMFAFETGGRIDELLKITLKDIIERNGIYYIILRGKGSKVRENPLPEDIIPLLQAYIQEFHKNSDDTDYLFYTVHSQKHTKMNPRTVNKFLEKYACIVHEKNPDFPLDLHAHMFRHSIGMSMYKAGIPLSYIRDFLGHSSVETVSIYAHADEEIIAAALDKVNELNPVLKSAANSDEASTEKKWKNNEEFLLKYCGFK